MKKLLVPTMMGVLFLLTPFYAIAADVTGSIQGYNSVAQAAGVAALDDVDVNVRVAAAEALGAVGAEAGTRALQRLLASPDTLLQLAALNSLAALRRPPALPLLAPLLEAGVDGVFTDDPAAIRRAGAVDLPLLQKYLNFWCSSSLDLFGSEISSNAAASFASGQKSRPDEDQYTDHVLREASFRMESPDGKGGSTPIVWDGKIFVTSPLEGQDALLAVTDDARLLWEAPLPAAGCSTP